MPRDRVLSRWRPRELAVVVVLAVVLVGTRQELPRDGWGEALRWAIGALLTVGVVVWLGGLLIATVRAFRRGLDGTD